MPGFEETTAFAQLLNPALKMFADVVGKETKRKNQNCRESTVFFIYGFDDFNQYFHALPFWFLPSLSSGKGA